MASFGSGYYEFLDHSHFDDPGQVHSPPDSCSAVSGPGLRRSRLQETVARSSGEDSLLKSMETNLVSGLRDEGIRARVESVRRFDYTSGRPIARPRIQSFVAYSQAVGVKCGGGANVKYAWFGGSKDELEAVLSNGFGCPNSDGTHGEGVYLSPLHLPAESLELATPDEDGGLQRMLLCRVILGRTEAVPPGSDQDNPSSEEFDSGVDSLVSPTKYVVWTSRMNTHILPEFVVALRTCTCDVGSVSFVGSLRREPSSDWMPLQSMIPVLARYLPCDAIELINKYHSDFKKKNITRIEMVQRLRHIAGDMLLSTILKSLRGKTERMVFNGSSSLQQSNKRNGV